MIQVIVLTMDKNIIGKIKNKDDGDVQEKNKAVLVDLLNVTGLGCFSFLKVYIAQPLFHPGTLII